MHGIRIQAWILCLFSVWVFQIGSHVRAEGPPSGFQVDTWYIGAPQGHALSKYDVYIASLGILVDLAHDGFNDSKPQGNYKKMPRVGIWYNGVGYQVKSLLWTIFTATKFMEDREHFGELNFKTVVGERVLGLGRFYARGNELEGPNETTASSANEQVYNLTYPTVKRNAAVDAANQTIRNPTLQDKFGISFSDLEFLRRGARFQPFQILKASMKIIIDMAELDLMASSHGILHYFSDGNFWVQVRPLKASSWQDLKNYIIVYAIQALTGGLANEGARGRWMELRGKVKWDGQPVAQISITKAKPNDAGAIDIALSGNSSSGIDAGEIFS